MNTMFPAGFTQGSLDRFRGQLRSVALHDLDMDERDASEFADGACSKLVQDRTFTSLGESLTKSGIGSKWNAVCAARRAPEIAAWAASHIRGNVIDLLCGDGRVGEHLKRMGIDTLLVERRNTYEVNRNRHSTPFEFFEDGKPLSVADTILVSTVLHHESEPEELLALAAESARCRLILIENCLESDYPSDCQQFMDLFFNHCLNHTALESPMCHRTPAAWIEACQGFGHLIHVERKERLPGIPLSHHLIVIEKQ